MFKEKEYTDVAMIKKFFSTLISYGDYKRGFSKDVDFPPMIEGNSNQSNMKMGNSGFIFRL